MTSFLQTTGELVLFKSEAFERLRRSKDGMAFALKLFTAVGLIAGLGTLSGVTELTATPTVAERTYQAAETVEAWAGQLDGFMARVLMGPAQAVAAWFTDLGITLESFEPPLGVRPSRVIRLIGEWLTTPLTLLTHWMTAILPVLLVAKFMGARGSLRELVSLSLVSVSPQILTVVGSFTVAEGSVWASVAMGLGILAFVWGLAILVKGLSIAGEVDQRKAVTILVVTALVFYVLIPSIVLVIGGLKLWSLMQLLG